MTQTILIFQILMKIFYSIHINLHQLFGIISISQIIHDHQLVCYLGFLSLEFVCHLVFVIWNFHELKYDFNRNLIFCFSGVL